MPERRLDVDPVPPLPAGLDPAVARWLELGEARAMRDGHLAAAAGSAAEGNPLGFGCLEIAGAVATSMAAVDYFFFNRLIGLGVDEAATPEALTAVLGWYRERGVTKEAVHVATGARPAELTGWLAEAGLVRGDRLVKMWHDLEDLAPAYRFRRIEQIGAGQAGPYGDIIVAAFEIPEAARPLATATIGHSDWRHYLGYEEDVPVAAGAMRLEDGVAWVGFGATLEANRGRGWQSAMFLRRLHDARAEGCGLAVTETGEETEADPVNHSYRNMVKAGFRLGYARHTWYRR